MPRLAAESLGGPMTEVPGPKLAAGGDGAVCPGNLYEF